MGLEVIPQMSAQIGAAFVDTCRDEAITDALKHSWEVVEEGTVFKKDGRSVRLYIAGNGEGGGMNFKEGKKMLEKSCRGKDNIITNLSFLKNTDICVLFGFAGNATGTNLPYFLSELMKTYPNVCFIPLLGLPLREQSTEIKVAVDVTMKDFKRSHGKGKSRFKLPSPAVVDNSAFPDLNFEKMNRELAEAISFFLHTLENSHCFRFDIADIKRTLESPEFALFGHGHLGDNSDPTRFMVDTLGSLVNIEQQFAQPSNIAGYGVLAVKTPSPDTYKKVARWAGTKLKHCKVSFWQDGTARFTEVVAIVGGLPWKAVRPQIVGVK